ncbi:sulfur transfer protein involved in thiamine biosynthesis [unidentified eubacterium SCB49]|nr:sulfur transfer protein involved in thiamine biosynthesis [unidentified eubacterium SCB49]
MIHIDFNSESTVTTCTSLFKLLEEKQLVNKTGIAVAVNQNIIPKSNWNSTSLQSNDSILVITATQGG